MARDWRKVALAVFTAATLGAGFALGAHAQSANQPAKTAKAPEPAPSDEDEAKAPAKKKRQDPAEAQRAIDSAAKLLETGKADQAAQALTLTLAGGNLPPAILAKAFYVRGMAYRQQGKPAQAISDLTNALWLKGGLGGAERAEALKQRSAAYSDAGLTESGEAVATAAPATGKTKSWGSVTTPEDANPPSTGQASNNWFGNIFNWPAASQPAAKAPPPPPPPQVTASIEKTEPPAAAAKAPRVATAWSSNTQVKSQPEPSAGPPVAPPPASAAGRYKIQLATVRTQQEALALAAKAKREHAAALAAREPEIDQAVLGNMGAFYRIRVGPFATVQETQAVCAKLKGSGFDCMSVMQ
jgi:cell division septation protein DedD